ncbi:MAG: tetratricopeptide repeat protein [Holosporales bacterium]|jgi:hypothetical protein|nr:tetratricopeptide repeat protein [Holosporales bacterium]
MRKDKTGKNAARRKAGKFRKVVSFGEASNANKKPIESNLKSLTDKVDSFTESIMEEIRSENMKKIWDKYGKIVTIICVISLFAVGAYNTWKKNDIEEREAISIRFVEAQNLIMAGEEQKAMNELSEISTVKKKEYAVLAKLERAAVLAKSKNSEAIGVYKSVADDKDVDVVFRDLAYVLYVNAFLDMAEGKKEAGEVPGMIERLASNDLQKGPWGLIAKEALAFCYIKMQNNKKAHEVLESLVVTEGIPADMLNRCRILMQSVE